MIYDRTLQTEEARDFFQTLFPTLGKQERIELRYNPRNDCARQSATVYFEDTNNAVDFALTHGHSYQVFVRVAPQQSDVDTQSKGSRFRAETRLQAVSADLDFTGNHTMETRLSQLRELPCPPSMIVCSGGGLHAYWLLEKSIEQPQDLILAEQMLARFAEGLGGQQVGRYLSRVMRVPGTLNHTYEDPRMVRLVHCAPGTRYTLDQLVQMAEVLPENKMWYDLEDLSEMETFPDFILQEGMSHAMLVSLATLLHDHGFHETIITEVVFTLHERSSHDWDLRYIEAERIAKSVCRPSTEDS